MKKWTRMSILLLAAMLVLAACSGNNGGSAETEAGEGNGSASGSVVLTEPGAFPIVEEPVELTVLIAGDSNVEDFQTNAFTKWYEEQTNVKVNFEVAPVGGSAETLNLRLASGDLPDIFLGMGVSRAQEMIYGPQGVFQPLNDLIEEHGYYMKQAFEEQPKYYDALVTPDGNIYSLPEINECYHCSMPFKLWMYEPFLEAIGMTMPQSTEEFYTVLKAFKEDDPNGNGKADEIPLAGAIRPGASKAVELQVEMFLMNAFVYTPSTRMYLEDGSVTTSFTQSGWKEGLKYLNRLYADGLIAGESFTQDEQQLRQLGEHAEAPILGAFPGIYVGNGAEIGGASGRWLDYTTVPPLEGPDGVRYAVSNPYQFTSGKAVITTAAEHPEVALRWLDGFFDEDIMNRAQMGIPGEDFKEAGEGAASIDGGVARFESITPYGGITNNHWYQKAPAYNSSAARLSWSAGDSPEVNLEVILYNETHDNYAPYQAPLAMAIPNLYFTEEQSTELADLEKTIKDYVDQSLARFIIGEMDVDAEWDSYLANLSSMGLERMIAIYQEAYDAVN
ncbi:extracellular solute-binding protein [Paenibacillus sp. IB182496]|uniref:Extracellular solute-binding protein n=1 Tax=Paenibacillus sabuli TaxID=2772509 RepID=A0A927BTF6_9BACL|nr:extracellular solute-binding protein [Paenibacillus sabuli]MBD2845962.1 extracellular solute-binding protein [Paenibacillus sabuli]